MFMTHVEFPAKGIITMRYWKRGALIERAWQQTDADWEPCDPNIIKVVGMKGGIVKVYP